jgi:hypothetical protein
MLASTGTLYILPPLNELEFTMARGQHRHRMIRLRNLAQTKKDTRAANAPAKRKAAANRDARMAEAIKAAKGSKDLNPTVVSWACRQLNKEWRQVTLEDLAALTA